MSGQDNSSRSRSVLQFEAVPTAVGDLRSAVREQLDCWGLPAVAAEAELAVSELATNVIRHVGSGSAATLVLEAAGDRLRIELHDKSFQVPVFRSAACDAECGRGLRLLAGMAVDWGTLLTATGKAVWCELPAVPELRCRKVLRAESALAEYWRDAGAQPLLDRHTGRVLEESATGLIADLLHWVAARGGDPDGLLDRAQMHYEAEAAPRYVAEAV
ncbi:Anti-sigma regulatory factor (Ser/Thr protein kinase) [Streptomyces sp. 2131.1]|uniref:ATP-binding protein n=1 Tax=Streptomyces sp. 2131.1 TaxID=1855346 RepID=UPI000896C3A9|nr:ATP-binding protein [Streptomyces sp. 2131.1]SED59148.1 Anti-sigma regulatory factor (Ser/Thr protein kinase) [Streptomyces sp. 2131.1]